MKPWRSYSVLALCVLLSAGCGKRASQEIDYGTVQDSVYQNKYFGVSLKLPADWVVQDQEARQKIQERGRDLVAGENKNMKSMMKASEQQTVNLLAVFKHPVGAPVPFNPSIMGLAERVRGLPGIVRGKDYLFHARKLLESGQLKLNFGKEISTTNLGGVDFDVMSITWKVGASNVQQKYYATIMKGYALAFVTSFTNPEEESALNQIRDTIKFQSAP